LALLGFVEARWQLFGAYAVMAIGWAMAGLVPATTLITRWYQAKRASALSIASTGLSVGGVVLTPIAKAMIDNRGLRATTPWLGLTWVAIIVPTAWWLLLPSPEAAGWLPDGERSVGAAPVKQVGVPYRQGVRTRFFVGVTAAYTLLLCSQVGGIQHLVRLFEERSTAAASTAATSVVAAASIVARLAGGQVVRRVPSVMFTVALGAVQAVALVMLGGGRSTATLMIATALFGITVGNVLMMQPLLIAERFGVADYPRLFSTSQAVTMVGTAGGPLLLGAMRDGSGYGWAYTAAALLAAVGVTVLALGDRPDAMTTEAATVP
jgi:MFS family permease